MSTVTDHAMLVSCEFVTMLNIKHRFCMRSHDFVEGAYSSRVPLLYDYCDVGTFADCAIRTIQAVNGHLACSLETMQPMALINNIFLSDFL